MSIPLEKLSFLQQVWPISRSELQQESHTGSWDRVWGAGIVYCNAWNKFDNCPIKIPSLDGIISYSQARWYHFIFPGQNRTSKAKPLISDTWKLLLSGTYNLWMFHLCSDLVTPQVPWAKESESGQFYGFTNEVFLHLDLFCAYEEDMNILQGIGVLSSINVIFASTIGTVVSIDQ